ncbi:uncharacterized protein F5891DRAFT_1082481 [Suillus fuscotomentosus]|uniref:Uncharacterized protein n=1 Tax=Suillus fuscotomentosus TaxID=1912939 RepID=A0AAD4HC08_9AGAM|nr:uncharacterized protein F5891DRAFT_1082481 [Suillus fuscotomentosus]KAG1886407.1 hypothetical protein F5891DRAFT_1082481 [Suillus fuscotomentosus]
MHEHLGLELNNRTSIGLSTPQATQAASASGPGSSSRTTTSTGQSSTSTGNATAPGSSAQARTSQQPAQHANASSAQSSAPQQNRAPVVSSSNSAAPNSAPNVLHQPAAQPAVIQPVVAQQQPLQAPADEIDALRARIAELERGEAHGNHLPARAPAPQQAMVADPTTVDRIQTNLNGAKEESKRPSLPALRPGHKVSALSLRVLFGFGHMLQCLFGTLFWYRLSPPSWPLPLLYRSTT